MQRIAGLVDRQRHHVEKQIGAPAFGELGAHRATDLTRADGSSLGATSGETISKQYGWSKWRETLVRTMYNATRYHM